MAYAMVQKNDACKWLLRGSTTASKIYGTKLKNLLMGRGSSNSTSMVGQRRICFDDIIFHAANQTEIEAAYTYGTG